MKIEKIKISDLSCDPANARLHPEHNIETLVASLKRFGQQKPIVIDASNVVRAGNGTLEAARLMGWDEIDCVRTTLKGSDAIAYAIADNRTAELAEWDDAVLVAVLEGLQFDDEALLEAAGFDEIELMAMIAKVADIDEEMNDGLPDYDGTPVGSSTIIVHFASEDDRVKFANLLDVKITDKAKFVWYPAKPV